MAMPAFSPAGAAFSFDLRLRMILPLEWEIMVMVINPILNIMGCVQTFKNILYFVCVCENGEFATNLWPLKIGKMQMEEHTEFLVGF